MTISVCGLPHGKKLSRFFSLCSAHCEPFCSISTLVCGYAIGGNFLNIFSIALLSFWAVFSGLSGIVPVAVPRQITCLVLVSNKSTMSVPTVYVSGIVVA